MTGLRKLGDGVYVDKDGTLHLDAAEMCIARGFVPSQKNQDAIEAAAREVFAGTAIEIQEDAAEVIGPRGGWR